MHDFCVRCTCSVYSPSWNMQELNNTAFFKGTLQLLLKKQTNTKQTKNTILTSIHLCILVLILKWHHWKRRGQMLSETQNYLHPHTDTVRQRSIGPLSPRGLCVQTATHKTLWSPTLPGVAGCLRVL